MIEFSEMRGPTKIFGPFCEINGQNILFGPSDGLSCQMLGSGRVRVLKKISGSDRVWFPSLFSGFQVYKILDFPVFRVYKKNFGFGSGSGK